MTVSWSNGRSLDNQSYTVPDVCPVIHAAFCNEHLLNAFDIAPHIHFPPTDELSS